MQLFSITYYTMMGIECLLLIPFTLNYKWLDKAGKWAYYYLISSVFFIIGSSVLARLFHSNLWFLSIMHLVQFLILSGYYHLIIKNGVVKKVIKILLIPTIAIFFLDFFKLEGMMAFNSIFATIRTFLLLSYGILFFIQLLFDEELIKESVFINTLPNFWFNAGLFIYLCSSFLQALTYNFFVRNSLSNPFAIPTLIFVSGIIEGILFYIGLLKAKKQRS